MALPRWCCRLRVRKEDLMPRSQTVCSVCCRNYVRNAIEWIAYPIVLIVNQFRHL